MSKTNYYISDLHLFHKNVTDEGSNFDGRPFKTLEEMHKTIKENWNNTVTNADHVYILGDLAWKENEDAIQFVSTLRGNKHLILGNHCKATDQRYRQLFVEVVNYKEIKDINWPNDCLVVSIYRGEKEILPKGDTKIYAGDLLVIMTNEDKASYMLEDISEKAATI